MIYSFQIGWKGQKNYSKKFQVIYHIRPTTCFCVAQRLRAFFPHWLKKNTKEGYFMTCENYMKLQFPCP